MFGFDIVLYKGLLIKMNFLFIVWEDLLFNVWGCVSVLHEITCGKCSQTAAFQPILLLIRN